MCVAAASGEVMTKMDDDDYYGPDYLSDQLYALQYSGADVVGKQAHYMYLAEQNATILRFADWEHRYSRMIMGPTILGRSEIIRAQPFAAIGRGEDTQFLTGITSNGGVIYSSDRFNYCQQRLSADHTWNVDDFELIASGTLKFLETTETKSLSELGAPFEQDRKRCCYWTGLHWPSYSGHPCRQRNHCGRGGC
ncbi:hypothetical protein ACW0JT_12970 [Arthrobacter sp. SA17]